MKSEFLQAIQKDFPEDFLTRDPVELAEFGKDWTRVYDPKPAAVVFPRTTDEVARFTKLCAQWEMPIVPSGGRTGLAGGAVACKGEIVLSLNRMNRIGPVDTLAQTVRVQAGAVTEAVHQHCESHGLTWPVDFASKGSSQVGGNISTNAGGVRVIRYGNTRQWVLGLQVVTMQGDILELNGALEKNNTGVDLRQLFIGSEGTLGIITEATLKLTRTPGAVDVFFFSVADIPGVLKLFQEVRRSPFVVNAFETLTHNCIEAVSENLKIHSPFSEISNCYVLLEIDKPGGEQGQESLDAWLAGLFEKGLVTNGTLAQSPREAKELWMLREGISESVSKLGFVHKNDVALPISKIEGFVAELMEILKARHSDLEVYLWGHIGDGNLHINTMKPSSMGKDDFLERCRQTDGILFTLVRKFHGSVSAEHGIGLLKKSALHFSRSNAELKLFRALKNVLDPKGLLNPGKIFD